MKRLNRFMWAMCIVSVVALSLSGVTAQANTTNPIPFYDAFETYADGEGIIGTNGWYGPISTAAVVVADNYSYPLERPLPSEAHTRYLQLVEPFTNLIDHAAGADTNIWVDLMLQPVRGDDQVPELEQEPQVAAYFNSNGLLTVRHMYFTDVSYNYATKWTTLAHPPVPTGEWTRVTLNLDYLTGDFGGGLTLQYFQISLFGGDPITNQYALTERLFNPGNPPPTNGTWFLMASADPSGGPHPTNVNSLSIRGTGYMDDLVVTNGDVFADGQTRWPVVATVSPAEGGTVYPGGSMSVLDGEDVTFTIHPDTDYLIDTVLDNGAAVGVSNSIFTITNVTMAHTVVVNLAAQSYTTKNVAYDWMDSFGITNDYENAQDVDHDGDGSLTWEEYVAGTIPTDSNSVFHVMSVEYLGGTNRVTFYATDVNVNDPFTMLRNTNDLRMGVWETNEVGIARDPSGTNVWEDTDAPEGPAFYLPIIPWSY